MRFEFKLPDLAEGMIEGELVAWLVAAGDALKPEQPVAEVMTDKATVVIPSPGGGKVLELPHKAGDIVKVGATLFVMESEGDAPLQKAAGGHAADLAPGPALAVAPRPTPAAGTAAVVAHAAPVPPAAVAAGIAAGPALPAGLNVPVFASVPRGPGRALASPATRRLARELGLDIGEVVGSGPGGRVTSEDVEHHAGGGAAPTGGAGAAAADVPTSSGSKAPLPAWTPASRAAADGEVEERVKLRGLRRAIYETMARSKATAAHFTYVDEVDCEALVAARDALAGAAAKKGVKLTYLAFIAKAALLAIQRFPKINAEMDDANQELVLKKYVHLGIAAATDPGLIVPRIRHAERLSILDLAGHIGDLAERARTNKLRPDEVKGSTFTITSLGKLGGLFATPIINHPEVAILGVHQMSKRAVVVEDPDGDDIVIRRRMNLSLSFDHRVIDGHEGAAFAQAIKAYLEQPELMLLEMT